MAYYGYHRVSTKEQHLDRGIKGIEEFCEQRNYPLEKIYVDEISGKDNIENRPRYIVLKEDVLRAGDTLILWELDRLSRVKKQIAKELQYFEDKGVRVMFLDVPTSTIELPKETDAMNKLITDTINKVVIEIYSMQAEAELQRKEKRVHEGIQAKKDRGEWEDYGRPRIMKQSDFAKEYKKVVQGKISSMDLQRQLESKYGMKKPTYFKYVKEFKDK